MTLYGGTKSNQQSSFESTNEIHLNVCFFPTWLFYTLQFYFFILLLFFKVCVILTFLTFTAVEQCKIPVYYYFYNYGHVDHDRNVKILVPHNLLFYSIWFCRSRSVIFFICLGEFFCCNVAYWRIWNASIVFYKLNLISRIFLYQSNKVTFLFPI